MSGLFRLSPLRWNVDLLTETRGRMMVSLAHSHWDRHRPVVGHGWCSAATPGPRFQDDFPIVGRPGRVCRFPCRPCDFLVFESSRLFYRSVIVSKLITGFLFFLSLFYPWQSNLFTCKKVSLKFSSNFHFFFSLQWHLKRTDTLIISVQLK